uniref:Uncharacterized protein n=1 Tax=Rhizophora mucronata TaxID=61149 RepID=A0A2P2N4C8_RHIMU
MLVMLCRCQWLSKELYVSSFQGNQDVSNQYIWVF